MVDVYKVAVADKWNKHLLIDGKKWLKWPTQMQSFSFSVLYDINVQPTGRYLLCSDCLPFVLLTEDWLWHFDAGCSVLLSNWSIILKVAFISWFLISGMFDRWIERCVFF